MAAEAASLKISMLLTFCGSTALRLETCRPSTMYSGSLASLEFDEIPRIRMEPMEPGSPEEEMTWTPDVLPAKAAATLSTERFFSASLPTEAMEPVTSLFFWTP